MRLYTVGSLGSGLAACKALGMPKACEIFAVPQRSANALRAATLHLNRSCSAQGLLLCKAVPNERTKAATPQGCTEASVAKELTGAPPPHSAVRDRHRRT